MAQDLTLEQKRAWFAERHPDLANAPGMDPEVRKAQLYQTLKARGEARGETWADVDFGTAGERAAAMGEQRRVAVGEVGRSVADIPFAAHEAYKEAGKGYLRWVFKLLGATDEEANKQADRYKGPLDGGLTFKPSSTITGMGQDMNAWFDERLALSEKALAFAPEPDRLTKVIGGVASTVPVIAGGLVGGPVGATATAMGMQAGQQFRAAQRAGATGSDLVAAYLGGAAIGATEALPVARLFGRLSKLGGSQGRAQLIKRLVGVAAAQGGEEFVQEFGQTVMEAVLSQHILEYADKQSFADVMRDALDAGITGGLVGGIMGGGGVGIYQGGRAAQQRRQRGIADRFLKGAEGDASQLLFREADRLADQGGSAKEVRALLSEAYRRADADQAALRMSQLQMMGGIAAESKDAGLAQRISDEIDLAAPIVLERGKESAKLAGERRLARAEAEGVQEEEGGDPVADTQASNVEVLEQRLADLEAAAPDPDDELAASEHRADVAHAEAQLKAAKSAEFRPLGEVAEGAEVSAAEQALLQTVEQLTEAGIEVPEIVVMDTPVPLPMQGKYQGGRLVVQVTDGVADPARLAKSILFHELLHSKARVGTPEFKAMVAAIRKSAPALARAAADNYVAKYRAATGQDPMPKLKRRSPAAWEAAMVEEGLANAAERMPALIETLLADEETLVREIAADRSLGEWLRDFFARILWRVLDIKTSREKRVAKIPAAKRDRLTAALWELQALDSTSEAVDMAKAIIGAYKGVGKAEVKQEGLLLENAARKAARAKREAAQARLEEGGDPGPTQVWDERAGEWVERRGPGRFDPVAITMGEGAKEADVAPAAEEEAAEVSETIPSTAAEVSPAATGGGGRVAETPQSATSEADLPQPPSEPQAAPEPARGFGMPPIVAGMMDAAVESVEALRSRISDVALGPIVGGVETFSFLLDGQPYTATLEGRLRDVVLGFDEVSDRRVAAAALLDGYAQAQEGGAQALPEGPAAPEAQEVAAEALSEDEEAVVALLMEDQGLSREDAVTALREMQEEDEGETRFSVSANEAPTEQAIQRDIDRFEQGVEPTRFSVAGPLFDPRDDEAAQEYTSAATSRRQVPHAFNLIDRKGGWVEGTLNLDIGGGRFDDGTEFLAEKGVENLIYDPFNRSRLHNTMSVAKARKRGADTVTVANVLNVIAESGQREKVLRQAAAFLKPGGSVFIQVYEGDRSGKGAASRDGWQENRKLADYMAEVEAVFGEVERKGRLIVAKAPASQAEPRFSVAAPRIATAFSGMGTVEAALGAEGVIAVEFDPDVVAAHNLTHGTDWKPESVWDLDPARIAAEDPDLFHASPVCKNCSAAKRSGTIDEDDLASGRKVAQVIREARPRAVTVENVKAYKGTIPYQEIVDALDAEGYAWDAEVYDAADYGGAQVRERLVIRAKRDGALPPAPQKRGSSDWYALLEDLIPGAEESRVPKWERNRIASMAERGMLDLSRPIITMGGSASRNVANARNAGGPAPTLVSSEKAVPRIILPGGRSVRVSGRMMARLLGLDDSVRIPESDRLAKKVLGNGIHGDISREVIGPVAGKPSQAEPRFSVAAPLDSPEFRRWFGDSKVTFVPMEGFADEFEPDKAGQGEPLVVWRGRDAGPGRTVFDYGDTFWTDSKRMAEQYAGQPAFAEERGRKPKLIEGAHLTPAYLRIENPLIVDLDGGHVGGEEGGRDPRAEAIAEAKRLGHDGVIFVNGYDTPQNLDPYGTSEDQQAGGEGTVFVAFRPEQIKSATGNVGAFGQRPVTEAEAAPLGMTAAEANEAQARGDIRFSVAPFPGATKLTHGTADDFDAFDPAKAGHGVFYFSKADDRYSRRQAEAIAERQGRMVTVYADLDQMRRFDPLNDPEAARIMRDAGVEPNLDWVEYPDMADVAPPAIAAGYELFRVREPAVQDFSWAIRSDHPELRAIDNRPTSSPDMRHSVVGDGAGKKGLTQTQIEAEEEAESGTVADVEIDDAAWVGSDDEATGESRFSVAPSVGRIPKLSDADLAGKHKFVFFADRMRVGTYTGLFPDDGINIPLQGGAGYPFIKGQRGKAGWAFSDKGMWSRFAKRVDATDGIGIVTLFASGNVRGNLTFLRAYFAEAEAAVAAGRMSERRFLREANKLRRGTLASKKIQGIDAEWKGLWGPAWKSLPQAEAALAAAPFEIRNTNFFGWSPDAVSGNRGQKLGRDELVGAGRHNGYGFPNISDMVAMMEDPQFEGMPYGTMVAAVEFEQGQAAPTEAADIGAEPHLSYPVVIRGRGLGFLRNPRSVTEVVKSDKAHFQALRSASVKMADARFSVGSPEYETWSSWDWIGSRPGGTPTKAARPDGAAKDLYHGTWRTFSAFGDGGGLSDIGWYYLSDNPAFAGKYAASPRPFKLGDTALRGAEIPGGVTVVTPEGEQTAPAWETATPGLAVTKITTDSLGRRVADSMYEFYIGEGMSEEDARDKAYSDIEDEVTYTVTHINSGLAISDTGDDMGRAFYLAQEMGSVGRWEKKSGPDEMGKTWNQKARAKLRAAKKAMSQESEDEVAAMFGYSGRAGIGSGSQMHQAHLSTQNPLDLRGLPTGRISRATFFKTMADMGFNIPRAAFFESGGKVYEFLNKPAVARNLRAQAIEAGHDSIVFNDYHDRSTRGESWIAFYPGQIKSVWNDGSWNPSSEDTRYSVADPGGRDEFMLEVGSPLPGGVSTRQIRVVKNPTIDDYSELGAAARERFPNMPRGEATTRFTKDAEGNKYVWLAHEAGHGQVDPAIEARFGTPVSQNMKPDGSRFSVAAPDAEGFEGIAYGELSRLEQVRRQMQDYFYAPRKAQAAVKEKRGGELPQEQDVDLAETLFSGRAGARLESFEKAATDELNEILGDDLTLDDAHDFAYAAHAPERNAWVMSQYPDGGWGTEVKPGSGMRTSEAKAFVKGKLEGEHGDRYRRLNRFLRRMARQELRTLDEAGLLTEGFKAAIEAQGYKYYVPLIHTMKNRPTILQGRGFNVKGSGIKRAKGRTSAPDNVVLNLLAKNQQAIVRAEKARVDRALYELVKENPDPSLWTVMDVPVRIEDDGSGVLKQLWDVRIDKQDQTVFATIDGEVKAIVFNERGADLARALNKTGVDGAHAILRKSRKVLRYLAAINTSWNPEFVVTNFLRDAQTAGIVVGAEGKGGVRAVLKGAIPAIREIHRHERGAETSEWWQRMKDAGGKTGWYHAKSLDEIQQDLSKSIRRMQRRGGERAMNTGHAIAEAVENANLAVENGVRLSAFKWAVENGASDAQAAEFAKNLTVNFNRQGEAQWLSSLYMFANASIQGSTRILTTLAKSKYGKRVAAGLVLGGLLSDMLNYLASPDDEDGENAWDAHPEWAKDRYFMVPDGNGGFFSVPMPYGFNFFQTLGRKMGEMARYALGEGGSKPTQAGADILSSAIGAFSPIGDFHSADWQSGLRFASPTVLDPMVELATNRDWRNAPIRPEGSPFDRVEPPAHTVAWDSTNGLWKSSAGLLNWMTGGDEFTEGAVSVSPEDLQYLTEFSLGGVLRFGNRMVNAFGQIPDAPVQAISDMPWIRQLHRTESERKGWTTFRENAVEIEWAQNAYDVLRERGDKEGAAEIEDEFGWLLKLSGDLKRIDRRRKRQRRKIDAAEGEAQDELVDELYADIREFNRKVNEARP